MTDHYCNYCGKVLVFSSFVEENGKTFHHYNCLQCGGTTQNAGYLYYDDMLQEINISTDSTADFDKVISIDIINDAVTVFGNNGIEMQIDAITVAAHNIVINPSLFHEVLSSLKELCVNKNDKNDCNHEVIKEKCLECGGTGILDFGFYTRKCMKCYHD